MKNKTTIQVEKEIREYLNKVRKEKDLRSNNAVLKKVLDEYRGKGDLNG